jgi:prepilin-type N-terminal cleavage/methylation domain-containing protein
MVNARERGFTMVELLITMAIFVIVVAAASQVFTALLTQFKQQSKISQSDTEGIVGLEVFRRDLAQAGYGLPWNLNTATYNEAVDDDKTFFDDRTFNDATSNPPRAIVSGSAVGITRTKPDATVEQVPNSTADVIAIKAVNVAMNDSSQKWTYIGNNGLLPNVKKIWNPNTATPPVPANYNDDLADNEPIIVLNPLNGNNQNVLQVDSSGNFYTTLGDSSFSFNDPSLSTPGPFEPAINSNAQFIAYGIAPGPNGSPPVSVTPRMPFNRADYYVKIPSSNMPGRCAPNTGILYKAVVNNTTAASGGTHAGSEYPLLDCVADMKIDYWLADSSGNMLTPPVNDLAAGIAALPADTDCADAACRIRKHLMEVRVYVIAQEGQVDLNYDFTKGDSSKVSVSAREIYGNQSWQIDNTTTGNPFAFANLKNLVGTVNGDPNYYRHYRWKLYTLVVQPNSMR